MMLDRIGRRPMFLISMTGMIVAYVLITGMSAAYNNNPDAPNATSYGQASVGFIFIFSIFYDIAWTPMTVLYPVEILPYTIRAKGMAIQGAGVAIALFFNQYVNPVALAAIGWKYYIVYDIWLCVELLIVWRFFKETRNKTLEALAEVFDGPNAALTVAEQHKLEELANFDQVEKA
jgi:MFS family permease